MEDTDVDIDTVIENFPASPRYLTDVREQLNADMCSKVMTVHRRMA